MNAALSAVEAAFKNLSWNMTPVHILREALINTEGERMSMEQPDTSSRADSLRIAQLEAELQRKDEVIRGVQMIRDGWMDKANELKRRAERAEEQLKAARAPSRESVMERQCRSYAAGGLQCKLSDGHQGQHVHGEFAW